MKKLLIGVLFSICMMCPNRPAFAWNPVTDIRDNVVWTFGKTAEIGTAIKLGGAGDLETGDTTTSFLAGIAEYRFLALSYGGTRINKDRAEMTDTCKVGIRLAPILGWFKNPPTPEMAMLKNINVGPSLAFPIFSNPHTATWFFDFNYEFNGLSGKSN